MSRDKLEPVEYAEVVSGMNRPTDFCSVNWQNAIWWLSNTKMIDVGSCIQAKSDIKAHVQREAMRFYDVFSLCCG